MTESTGALWRITLDKPYRKHGVSSNDEKYLFLLLRKYFKNSTSHLPVLLHGADGGGEVSSLAVFHDDVELAVTAVYDAVVVQNYVFVLQLTQQIHLRHEHLLLYVRHHAVVELLPHKDLAGGKVYVTEGSGGEAKYGFN